MFGLSSSEQLFLTLKLCNLVNIENPTRHQEISWSWSKCIYNLCNNFFQSTLQLDNYLLYGIPAYGAIYPVVLRRLLQYMIGQVSIWSSTLSTSVKEIVYREQWNVLRLEGLVLSNNRVQDAYWCCNFREYILTVVYMFHTRVFVLACRNLYHQRGQMLGQAYVGCQSDCGYWEPSRHHRAVCSSVRAACCSEVRPVHWVPGYRRKAYSRNLHQSASKHLQWATFVDPDWPTYRPPGELSVHVWGVMCGMEVHFFPHFTATSCATFMDVPCYLVCSCCDWPHVVYYEGMQGHGGSYALVMNDTDTEI